jgi:hypothetical protein
MPDAAPDGPDLALRTSNPPPREAAVYAIVMTFDLVDMTPEQYAQLSAELAPSFAGLPGWLTKIWLTGNDQGRRGGACTCSTTKPPPKRSSSPR